LLGAALGKGGSVELDGLASPGAAIRLASATGGAQFTTADASGRWKVEAPPSGEPRVFALSMSDQGRVVQAAGFLFVGPDGVIARLKTGGGSEVVWPPAHGRLTPALDYDNQRAASLSGVASPGENLSVHVDGVERGQAAADSSGHFILALNQPLTPGTHDFDLAGGAGDARFSAEVDQPNLAPDTRFRAQQTPLGWRIDWTTPGGGPQTTLLFDRLGPPS
jgi:hypothetical protein